MKPPSLASFRLLAGDTLSRLWAFRRWDWAGVVSLGLVAMLEAYLDDSAAQRLLLAALVPPLLVQWLRPSRARDATAIIACGVLSVAFLVADHVAISGDWLIVAAILGLSLALRIARSTLVAQDWLILAASSSLALLLSFTSQMASFPLIPQLADSVLSLPTYPSMFLNQSGDQTVPTLDPAQPPAPLPQGTVAFPAVAMATPQPSLPITPLGLQKPWFAMTKEEKGDYRKWVEGFNPVIRRYNVATIHYERQVMLHAGVNLVTFALLLFAVSRPLVRQGLRYLRSTEGAASEGPSESAHEAGELLGTNGFPRQDLSSMPSNRSVLRVIVKDLRHRARLAKLTAYISVGLILICLVSGLALFAFADTIYSRNKLMERFAERVAANQVPAYLPSPAQPSLVSPAPQAPAQPAPQGSPPAVAQALGPTQPVAPQNGTAVPGGQSQVAGLPQGSGPLTGGIEPNISSPNPTDKTGVTVNVTSPPVFLLSAAPVPPLQQAPTPPTPAGSAEIDSRLVSTLSTRIGSVLILLFLVQILVTMYRYNIKLSSHFEATADAFLLAGEVLELDRPMPIEEFLKFLQGMSPAIPFKEPKTPIENAQSLTETVLRKGI